MHPVAGKTLPTKPTEDRISAMDTNVDLATDYVGLKLRNPVILASAGTTEKVNLMKLGEEHGAGAVVMKSLFEKEVTRVAPTPRFRIIRHRIGRLQSFAFYSYEQASIWGPERYSAEIAAAKRSLSIPVIASINCVTDGGWVSYARAVENAGADALELNISCPHSSVTFTGDRVVERIIEVARAVRAAVKIPVVVKLSGQLTQPILVAKQLEATGVNGLVIFNRFTGLDIDIESEQAVMHRGYAGHGGPWAIHYPLRWVSELAPQTSLHLSGSGGVSSAADVIKYLLAGATTVQVCTLVYLEGFEVIEKLLRGLSDWMTRKGYRSVSQFRGKVSGKAILGVDEVDRRHVAVAEIDPEKCVACGLCARICLYGAPAKEREAYRIAERCDGCGLCQELCPKSAIRMVQSAKL